MKTDTTRSVSTALYKVLDHDLDLDSSRIQLVLADEYEQPIHVSMHFSSGKHH